MLKHISTEKEPKGKERPFYTAFLMHFIDKKLIDETNLINTLTDYERHMWDIGDYGWKYKLKDSETLIDIKIHYSDLKLEEKQINIDEIIQRYEKDFLDYYNSQLNIS